MRAEKQFLLDAIEEKIEDFGSFIVAKYEKLTAVDTRTFRREMAKLGSEYEVVRKRVFLKATKNKGIEIDPKLLEGHVGIVFSKEEPMETAKAIVDFGKECGGTFEMIAGHVEGKVCNSAEMQQLASMPSKDQLRAQLLALLQAPMAQSTRLMNALLTSLVTCMDNKVKKES